MVLLCPRIHFYEINDQSWFPQYLREKVQSCLTLCWTFRVPIVQKSTPAALVGNVLYKSLGSSVTDYTFVDFCAGAGGPTPFFEKSLNAQLASSNGTGYASSTDSQSEDELTLRSPRPMEDDGNGKAVKFILTDIHPHIPEWTRAAKKSEHLSFVGESVDATNAPASLYGKDGKKIFRLYNLAFHHFDHKLGLAILKNTIETADGFGVFELQERTISSLFTVCLIWPLLLAITPFYFWRSPGHLFFTYLVPIIPFVVVFDGLVSSLRTRTPEEIQMMMKQCGADCDDWQVKSGHEVHTWPTGYVTWFIGSKKTS